MRRPTVEEFEQLARSVRSNPYLLRWVARWRDEELRALPNAINNTALSQGRCQVLNELTKLLEEAADYK